MTRTSTIVCLAATLLTACAVPTHKQPHTIAHVSDCPEDWTTLSAGDKRVKQLPTEMRVELAAIRDERFEKKDDELSAATKQKVADINRRATDWYAATAYAILKDPSPEMYSISATQEDAERNIDISTDQNLRIAADDWNRFWLWGFPSMLSPTPIVDTSGQPR